MNTTGAEFQTPSFTAVPVGFDAASATTTLTVFFTDSSGDVTAVTRTVPQTVGVLRASLEQLLLGPTDAEQASGLSSFFSAAGTGDLAVDVTIQDGGTAVVDLDSRLPERIPNASTSAGSQQLVAELNATVFQFPTVTAVEYRLGGSCEAFWSFLQRSCETIARP
jgi:spore germination protein GerM